jgi:hypothetical protein
MNRYSRCTFGLALKLLILASGSSIDIKTLPPDPETKDLLAAAILEPTRRSVIVPDWAGDHSAVLDGDQGRVILSWSVQGEYVNFQVLSCFLTYVQY